MAVANDYYTYRVLWSNEDKEYVGLCAEFPSLSWLAETQEEAFLGIRGVVGEVVSDMQLNGEPIPEPIVTKRYSGHILVRVPPEVHQTLALEAAESNISLNRLVNAKLTTP
jgi:predicted RNase H-like HicB family nuclease